VLFTQLSVYVTIHSRTALAWSKYV
jgi:hypothetical protein